MVIRSAIYKKWIAFPVVQVLLFCLGSFLLYFPNLRRTFASDDFLVMKRVGMDKVIWIKGFFRPLSDISLYFNYFLGGFHPIGYYALNILLHGIASYLFYLFCLRWRWTQDDGQQRRYALAAALLFLFYPFHSESIVWVLGRASLLANVLGMGTLLAVVSRGSLAWRVVAGSLCYFIGMAGYESVLLLPLMVLVVLYDKQTTKREYTYWAMALGMAFVIHLLLRILISGGVAGGYGNEFLHARVILFAGNLFRLTERLFLPPMQSTRLIAVTFILLAGGLILAVRVFLRRRGSTEKVRHYFLKLFLLLVIACGVPFLSGVSTHTSESDRFLYFPSYFLCAGVAFLLVSLIREKRWLATGIAALLVYETIFLERTNLNWVRASDITGQVLSAVSRERGQKIFVVNLPDEVDGAFIFRLGLPDALLMMGRDTSRLVIVNHLRRDDEIGLPDSLTVEMNGAAMKIAPGAVIERVGTDSFRITGAGDAQNLRHPERNKGYSWTGTRNDIILYWNRKGLLVWNPLQ